MGGVGSLTKGGYDVLTTQYTPPLTDLSEYAQKSGADVTGNVGVTGTLSQLDYNA